MSGEVKFDASAVKTFVHNRVFNGVDVLAARIQGNAKSNAPVRKTEKYQRSFSNRRRPIEVGFYRSDSRRVGVGEALTEIATALGGGTTDEDLARVINRGDVKGNLRNMARIRAKMQRLGIRSRLVSRGNHASAVVHDVARLHGVTIQTDELGGITGRAELGGTLRRSIVTTGARDRGQRVQAKVFANARYARWVEFGSAHTHGHAQPFMMPAFKAFGTKEQLAKEIKW